MESVQDLAEPLSDIAPEEQDEPAESIDEILRRGRSGTWRRIDCTSLPRLGWPGRSSPYDVMSTPVRTGRDCSVGNVSATVTDVAVSMSSLFVTVIV